MTLNFNKDLIIALKEIKSFDYYEFLVHDEIRTFLNSDEVLEKYGEMKWSVVDTLNQKFDDKFDLYNWINKNKGDEVAYFLNETGSNCLNHSQFKIPYKFHLWLGKTGFIIAVEQKGAGFDALFVNKNRVMENEGAAFVFFRECQGEIFFDNCREARVVFMKYLS